MDVFKGGTDAYNNMIIRCLSQLIITDSSSFAGLLTSPLSEKKSKRLTNYTQVMRQFGFNSLK